MVNGIRAFVFDLDGVVTDTAEFHFRAWKALAGELGIDFDREFNEQLKGISRMDSLDLILEHGGLIHRFTTEEKELLAAKKNKHYQELIQQITPKDILPGILPLLEELKQNEIRIGLASASKNANTVLDSLQLTQAFNAVVDSSKITKGKPDPEIFLTAANLLQVHPENCIGIEDASSGITAINLAGMFSIGIGDKVVLSHANLVFPSTAELNFKEIISFFNKA